MEHYKVFYRTIFPGNYFGDYEIIHSIARVNAIKVQTNCSMLFITKNIYRKLIEKDHPELLHQMTLKANNENRLVNKSLNDAFTIVNSKIHKISSNIEKAVKKKEVLGLELYIFSS